MYGEALQMILAAVRDGSWKAIKMGRRGVPLSHLFFADDLIIFGEASISQAKVVKKILKTFCDASGHKVSQATTKIFFSKNTLNTNRRNISRKLGYLGVPLIKGRVSSSLYNHILERIQVKLAGWKRSSLSLVGRITLAKSVLTSIPFYTMQSTLLPANSCNAIEKIIRNFICGKLNESKGVNLVSWKELCQPLRNGGCGLLRLESQNRAFLAKMIYKFHKEDDTLWVIILRGKYGFNMSPKFPQNSSSFWKNMRKVWEDASLHIKSSPGDGTRVSFWSELWGGWQKSKLLVRILGWGPRPFEASLLLYYCWRGFAETNKLL